MGTNRPSDPRDKPRDTPKSRPEREAFDEFVGALESGQPSFFESATGEDEIEDDAGGEHE